MTATAGSVIGRLGKQNASAAHLFLLLALACCHSCVSRTWWRLLAVLDCQIIRCDRLKDRGAHQNQRGEGKLRVIDHIQRAPRREGELQPELTALELDNRVLNGCSSLLSQPVTVLT